MSNCVKIGDGTDGALCSLDKACNAGLTCDEKSLQCTKIPGYCGPTDDCTQGGKYKGLSCVQNMCSCTSSGRGHLCSDTKVCIPDKKNSWPSSFSPLPDDNDGWIEKNYTGSCTSDETTWLEPGLGFCNPGQLAALPSGTTKKLECFGGQGGKSWTADVAKSFTSNYSKACLVPSE